MKTEDTKVYVKCMEKVKERIGAIRYLNRASPPLGGNTMLTTELTFVQFRKILELIAFASLTSNKERYAEARKDFRAQWNADEIVKVVERINPNFYPMPVMLGPERAGGVRSIRERPDGYLTKTEFKRLYIATGEVLHMRNPFAKKQTPTRVDHEVNEYAQRIQNLVTRHLIRMVDGKITWIVTVPGKGNVDMRPVKYETL
jgi:hypothetical protein